MSELKFVTVKNKRKYNKILENIHEELNKQGISEEEFYNMVKENTPLKESRINNIMNRTNKRPITLKELNYLSWVLGLENLGYLLKDIC